MAVHSNTDWVLRIPGVTNPAESPLAVLLLVRNFISARYAISFGRRARQHARPACIWPIESRGYSRSWVAGQMQTVTPADPRLAYGFCSCTRAFGIGARVLTNQGRVSPLSIIRIAQSLLVRARCIATKEAQRNRERTLRRNEANAERRHWHPGGTYARVTAKDICRAVTAMAG